MKERPNPGAQFTKAMDRFAEALEKPKRRFSGSELDEAFLDVEYALFLLPTASEGQKNALSYGLAGRSAEAAEEKGFPEIAVSMREYQERIIDAEAIRNDEYDFVETRRSIEGPYGAPITATPIYRRPDGVEVNGKSYSISVGVRAGNAIPSRRASS
jgi:hypothetical protein